MRRAAKSLRLRDSAESVCEIHQGSGRRVNDGRWNRVLPGFCVCAVGAIFRYSYLSFILYLTL